ncbi:MAG: hypothetical protein AAFQ24_13060 [Pseudomonadota bacterium]
MKEKDKEAKRAGYYEGYKHGLAGLSYQPGPVLVGGFTEITYINIYLESYDQGYDQAKQHKDLTLGPRAQRLLASRSKYAFELERE